jgi:hypothetical protein
MRRSIFKAGVWTALGLAIAFAVVSANSNTRRAVTTAAPAAKATVANANATADDCTSSDVCCARESKVSQAVVAAAPRKATKMPAAQSTPAFSSGAVIAIDPETGELGMPSAQQMSELLGTPSVIPGDLNNSDVGLVDVQLQKGGVIRDLQGRFQETSTVTIAPDGKMVFGCGTHNHGLDISPTQAAPSAVEEK